MEKTIEDLKKENLALKERIQELELKLSQMKEKLSSRGEQQKKGMIKKASYEGKVMARPPFGYKIENKQLVPAENSHLVEEIFEEFLNSDLSLRKIAKKYGLSVNGLKKILTNFTYIGKIKFNNHIFQGSHKPLISSTLFNHVQNKLEKLGIKNQLNNTSVQ